MISHAHRTIFVHVPKTGGQSIEHVFLSDLGLTRPSAPLLLMPNPGSGSGPERLAHLTLADYIRHGYVHPEQYEDYFKFSVVRNPWTRVISIYRFLPYFVDFRTFVTDVLCGHLWSAGHFFVAPQSDYLTPAAGCSEVDAVLRFERLADEFDTVRTRLGLDTALPWVNRSDDARERLRPRLRTVREATHARTPRIATLAIGTKEHHPRAADYYDDETAAIVAERYAADIDRFGYAFDELG